LIGLLLVSYYYQASYNWSLIKKDDVEFATFPANGKPGHSALTNNGKGFALTRNNFKNIFFLKQGHLTN
jgi:hypothetical protein